MAKTNSLQGMSIADLEKHIARRRGEIQKLSRERAKLKSRMDKIDSRITAMGGSVDGETAGRVSRGKSLVATLEEVLRRAGKPLPVGALVEGALDAGYQSSSPQFRSIVNQALIKARGKFESVERGVYGLQKPVKEE